ncbi:DNA-binding protein [Listeria newyorkensis]|uniref:DNA-binding protein n=1 Tax=Listeria newyorkensis TaxID=1497681 RepID=A0ABX4XRF3_9LIST|nr:MULTISPECIES: XRE family transcriptional regulator [Listeria]KGL42056.1 DNA-binding protein [Listeriaceae bacterium FSL A5-0209]KGL46125.1 DNA-binding protein [Listeria newyorkensis]KMT62937.1 XRE family transcriptional regulator [Listeria newyorkensis]PNP94457.1 DNA-binding protein [Listeria newyorkensis]RQW67575.1 XRE family transcriptional regulator [Listeria sp. SHR_NRA_18]
MDNISAVVSENLKLARQKKRLSLDELAKLTGVSKSMLGQIERGDVNPTISTLWKIANGLKVSFTELVTKPKIDYEVIDRKTREPLIADDGKCRNYPMFTFDSERRFETYYLEIDPDGRLESTPHPDGTEEFITVFSGELVIATNGEELKAKDGDSIRFKADQEHVYTNASADVCRLSMIIYYPN